jgi:nucleoside 2-deoxyribosyltransferase
MPEENSLVVLEGNRDGSRVNEPLHTAPKPFVFVLMPFSEDFDDVYKLAIKAACERAGAYCERVDEQHYDEGMLERIYNQIAKADFIIADMSGRNSNVYYEVGYAHALDKRVILITKSALDIPFDLKHRAHTVYTTVSGLLEELEKRVRWAVENPKNLREFTDRQIAVYLEEKEIVNNPVIHMETSTGQFFFWFVIHNIPAKIIEPLRFQLALETDSAFDFFRIKATDTAEKSFTRTLINVGNGKIHCILKDEFELLPDSWLKFWWSIKVEESHIGEATERKMTFKLFTASGTISFPFRLVPIWDTFRRHEI